MNISEYKNGGNNLLIESAEDLYNNAPCGYISFIKDGTIVKINKTLLSWLGYETEEVVLIKRIKDFFNTGGKIFYETHFFPLIRIQGSVKEVNFNLVRKDKSVLPVLLSANGIATDKGSEAVAFRATIFDITDRKNYEKELINAKLKAESTTKAKAELLATISHEIRTPLNAITGIANLIHKTPLNNLQLEYARILKLSSDTLSGLVNDILDFSKIEAGKVKLEKKIFRLRELIDALTAPLAIKAAEKEIEIITVLDKDIPVCLLGDSGKLNQILTNLAGNAIKFTNAGYIKLEITVVQTDTEKDQIRLLFKVTDTGIGIPADKLNTIFEEFSQASYEVNLKYGGTGLGLTISQKLLQLHNSQMQVKSIEGKGTEFSFEINYEISSEAPDYLEYKTKAPAPLISDSSGILLVDDNQLNNFIVSQYLKEWNIPFDSVASGTQAILQVQQTKYNIILLDLSMPELNGYETSEAIKSLNLPDPPAIIAFSASSLAEVSGKLTRAGIHGYLPKPFKPADLYNQIIFYMGEENKGNRNDFPPSPKPEKQEERISDKLINPTSSCSPYDLTHYVKISKNNKNILKNLISKTAGAFEEYKEQFNAAVLSREEKVLSDIIHKSKMTVFYIKAQKLEEAMLESREIVKSKEVDESLILEKINELNHEFTKVIEGLKSVNPEELIKA